MSERKQPRAEPTRERRFLFSFNLLPNDTNKIPSVAAQVWAQPHRDKAVCRRYCRLASSWKIPPQRHHRRGRGSTDSVMVQLAWRCSAAGRCSPTDDLLETTSRFTRRKQHKALRTNYIQVLGHLEIWRTTYCGRMAPILSVVVLHKKFQKVKKHNALNHF